MYRTEMLLLPFLIFRRAHDLILHSPLRHRHTTAIHQQLVTGEWSKKYFTIYARRCPLLSPAPNVMLIIASLSDMLIPTEEAGHVVRRRVARHYIILLMVFCSLWISQAKNSGHVDYGSWNYRSRGSLQGTKVCWEIIQREEFCKGTMNATLQQSTFCQDSAPHRVQGTVKENWARFLTIQEIVRAQAIYEAVLLPVWWLSSLCDD